MKAENEQLDFPFSGCLKQFGSRIAMKCDYVDCSPCIRFLRRKSKNGERLNDLKSFPPLDFLPSRQI